MLPPELALLVDALPERYQPLFGHPAEDEHAVRGCRDRLQEIERVVDALGATLGRPVRVLDLGCAQGFFALSLASRGAEVTGVDRLPANIAVCRALAAERPALPVRFVEADAMNVLHDVRPGEYDLVLALSVLHHLCFEQGAAAVRTVLAQVADSVEIVLAEVAVRDEPLYWAAAQPVDPLELFGDYAFAHVITRHGTHLSTMTRPLVLASARWWYLGGMLGRFTAWSHLPRQGAQDVHRGTRRYFFSEDRIVKYFRFVGESATRNREELAREAAFLERPLAGLELPRFVAASIQDDHGWLVRALVPGRLASEVLSSGEPFDRAPVIGDVLDVLCALEGHGLYHADLRTWNVVVRPDGRSTLIDYGDVTTAARDCAWPYDLFLSFLLFVRELESGEVLRVLPVRTLSFAPDHFTPPLRGWITTLWRRPLAEWTFAYLRDSFRDRHSASGTPAEAPARAATGEPAWQFAVEQYLEIVGAHQKRLADTLEREEAERRAREKTVERLAGALEHEKENSQALQAEIRALRASMDRLSAERSAVRELVSEISARLAEALDDIEQMRSPRDQLLASQVGVETRFGALLARLDRLESAVGGWVAKRALLSEEVQRQKAEAAHWWRATGELQQELALVYSTWSWRLMAPLRLVRRVLPGGQKPAPAPERPRPARGLRHATRRFIHEHPRVKAWAARPLDRFPRAKGRLKRWLASPTAATLPPAPPVPVDESGLGVDAREVFAQLKREASRVDGDPARAP